LNSDYANYSIKNKNKDIFIARDYLKNIANIDITTINSWNKILEVRKIRNTIVHKNSKIEIQNIKSKK
jgi:hypothetical protein